MSTEFTLGLRSQFLDRAFQDESHGLTRALQAEDEHYRFARTRVACPTAEFTVVLTNAPENVLSHSSVEGPTRALHHVEEPLHILPLALF